MTLNYVRKQILIEKEQNSLLEKIADDDGISFSELVRKFINSQLRVRMYKEMELAADALYTDYSNDKDLTDMTLLDGEDVIDE